LRFLALFVALVTLALAVFAFGPFDIDLGVFVFAAFCVLGTRVAFVDFGAFVALVVLVLVVLGLFSVFLFIIWTTDKSYVMELVYSNVRL
jgi:hypothetical protein